MNREDFIILDQRIYDRPLVYLDNAATMQKPEKVINAMSDYYRTINSNIHRGVHYLSQRATDRFEQVRKKIQTFINAAHSHEVIFTRGTTESINLIASSFGKAFLSPGDEVIITGMEHHSNIVPWQLICEAKGAKIKIVPFNEQGVLEVEKFAPLITDKTKIVAITHVSNSLGTINPVKRIIDIAHSHNVPVMVDGAQAISHIRVDVQALDCDFYCFSGHKMYGPMGIGVMYGKEKWLEKMPPYQGGGEMIQTVTLEKSTYAELPFKFEAGTPSVGDAIGLEKAIEYIENIGIDRIAAYEEELLHYGVEKLSEVAGMDFVGTAPHKAAIISFNLKGIHPYDAGVIIDRMGVAVRTGHHCTQPVMDAFCIPGTIRASFALYNEKSEIDHLVEAVRQVMTMFG